MPELIAPDDLDFYKRACLMFVGLVNVYKESGTPPVIAAAAIASMLARFHASYIRVQTLDGGVEAPLSDEEIRADWTALVATMQEEHEHTLVRLRGDVGQALADLFGSSTVPPGTIRH